MWLKLTEGRDTAKTKARFSEYCSMALYLTVFVRVLCSASRRFLRVAQFDCDRPAGLPCGGGGVVAANTGSYKASDGSPPN